MESNPNISENNIKSRFVVPRTFMSIGEDLLKKMWEQFPLKPITEDDLYFSNEIEDDRINSSATLLDYDWMSYGYDTRFPTTNIGTLVIRFDYCGSTISEMIVKQYLPSSLTGMDTNIKILHRYSYPTSMFDEYHKRDLLARVENIHSQYAYNMGDLLIEWYNKVVSEGIKEPIEQDTSIDFHWDYIIAQEDIKK